LSGRDVVEMQSYSNSGYSHHHHQQQQQQQQQVAREDLWLL